MSAGLLDRTSADAPDSVAVRPDRADWSGLLAILTVAARNIGAAVAGMALSVGVTLLIWALAASVPPAAAMARAGLAAFAAGQGLSLHVGNSAITIMPLLLTLISAVLIAATAGRGRMRPVGGGAELAGVLTGGLAYGATATVMPAVFGPPTVVDAREWIRPTVFAIVVLAGATLRRGDAWRAWLEVTLPEPVRRALRAGLAGGVMLFAGAAVLVAIALGLSWRSTGHTFAALTPGLPDGLGLFCLTALLLPNAVAASVAYLSGTGFSVGAGSYAPFDVHPAAAPDLPLMTLLPSRPAAMVTFACLVFVPLVAGLVLSRVAVRRVESRWQRLAVVAGAALVAGAVLGIIVALAGGGVTGGAYVHSGGDGALVGCSVAAMLLIVGVVVALAVPAVRRADSVDDDCAMETDVIEDSEVSEEASDAGDGEVVVPSAAGGTLDAEDCVATGQVRAETPTGFPAQQ